MYVSSVIHLKKEKVGLYLNNKEDTLIMANQLCKSKQWVYRRQMPSIRSIKMSTSVGAHYPDRSRKKAGPINLPSEKAALIRHWHIRVWRAGVKTKNREAWDVTFPPSRTQNIRHRLTASHSLSYSKKSVHRFIWPSRKSVMQVKNSTWFYRWGNETKSGQIWDRQAIDSFIWQMNKCRALC